MSSNSNTPRLRFPGFEGEWEEKRLGDITFNEDSKRRPITKTIREKGEIPYYGANGIQDYVCDYIFDGNYLLVGEDGSVLTANNTPVINWASGKFWVNNHAHVLSQKDSVSLKLISYILSRKSILGLVTGIPPKLNQENLNNIIIIIPTNPSEQQKIASCLTEMDNLIASQGQKVEALKEKKKGLMQQLFPQDGETTPRLRFPGFEGEWEVNKLGDLCKRIADGSHNPPKGIKFSNNLMLSSQNVQDGCIEYSNVRYLSDEDFIKENKRTNLEADDVFVFFPSEEFKQIIFIGIVNTKAVFDC